MKPRDPEAAALRRMSEFWHPAFRVRQFGNQAVGSRAEHRLHGTFDGSLAGEKETIAHEAQADAKRNE